MRVVRTKIVLVSLTIFVLHGCGAGPPDNSYKPPPPPEVNVTRPVVQTVTQFIEENGETEAVERAEVRARVQGVLQEIKFKPWDDVKAGDILYTIEKKEFAAAVQAAKASVASAKAALQVAQAQVEAAAVEITRAELDFKRFKDLFDKGAGTQQELDESKAALDAALVAKKGMIANVETAKAEQQKAEANLAQVQLDLDYTDVKAPISGVITKTEVTVGNLVENGTVLAAVVDKTRIYANFNISDREALRLQKSVQAKGESAEASGKDRWRKTPAFLRRENDTGFPFDGTLDYVDQEGVDPSTGTLAIRCIFKNTENSLIPGLFVHVRVPVGKLEDALLIPERSLFRDQTGSYVLVVTGEKKIEKRPVSTGQTYEGMIVITDGLKEADWVLLDGSQRARPGVEVTPNETQVLPPSASTVKNKTEAAEVTEKTDDSDSQ